MTGHKIRLYIPRRESVSDPVGDPILLVNDWAIKLDFQTLPPRLARLVPDAFAHASDSEWKPFIVLATAMGKLGRASQ